MEVLIRPFRPDDWDGVFLLDQACFVPPYRLEYPRLRALVEDPTVAVLVIEAREDPPPEGDAAAERPVGEAEPDPYAVVGGLLLKHDQQAARLVVISVMIDSGFRRVGLGRKLIAWAERIARSRTLRELLAPLEAENSAGAAFLAALGFACEPGAPPFFADPAGGHLWRRPVTAPAADAEPAADAARSAAPPAALPAGPAQASSESAPAPDPAVSLPDPAGPAPAEPASPPAAEAAREEPH